MKFAFDLDETITAAPKEFAAIINALIDAEHEVHIITFRDADYHTEVTKKELEEYGIKYTGLHLTGDKESICKKFNINMALDDYASWHYPSFWRFTIGFALPREESNAYMKDRSARTRKMSATYSDETLDDIDTKEYVMGYERGYADGKANHESNAQASMPLEWKRGIKSEKKKGKRK
jgi:hypothetical protein